MEDISLLRLILCFVNLGLLLSLSLFAMGKGTEGLIDVNGRASNQTAGLSRKLPLSPEEEGDGNRIGTECAKEDIVVMQGSTAPLPNGVPAFAVEIVNTCARGCSIGDIHVSCGLFTSVRFIDPVIFRRIYYNDCLVNNGMPLSPGQTLSFQYANSFAYPLSVSSVSCY